MDGLYGNPAVIFLANYYLTIVVVFIVATSIVVGSLISNKSVKKKDKNASLKRTVAIMAVFSVFVLFLVLRSVFLK